MEASMDRDVWTNVVAAVDRAIRKLKPAGRTPVFSHRLIALMYLWAAWHDCCLSWACDRDSYGGRGGLFRPRGKLPSISRFARRVKGAVHLAILQLVHDDLAAAGLRCPVGYFDGKPLAVSPVSKDPDAKRGHVTGGFAKGYKLHAYVAQDRRIVVWSVTALNAAEQSVAVALCERLPPATVPDAWAMGDTNYDSALLHRALGERGRRLLTPLKGQRRVKDGQHHPVTLRQMGPERRAAVELDRACPELKAEALRKRNNVEGVFSVLSCVMKLGSTLPTFVRRLHRVTQWVGAKIILYNARILAQEQAAARVAA
jgi:hypothetical protein